MRIFLTGGDGYLGSNLVGKLLGEADLVLYGHGKNFKFLEEKFGKSFTAIQGDIIQKGKLVRSMRGSDIVIHLASTMTEYKVFQGIFGTGKVLESARENGVKRFIFTSTYYIYGKLKDIEREILTEDSLPSPVNWYASTKLINEDYILNAGIEYIILRPSHIYGYGVGVGDFGGILLKFIESALTKGRIVLTEDDIRDYIHVQDVVNCFKTIIATPSIKNEVFNLGSGQSVTLLELATLISQRIWDLLGKKVEVIPPEDILSRKPILSITKIKEKLGFEPKVSLTEGIDDLIRNLP